MHPAVIIDVILIGVLLAGLIAGAWRGLLASLAGLLVFIVALAGAAMIAGSFTQTAAEAVRPLLVRHIEKKVDAAVMSGEGDGQAAAPQVPQLPEEQTAPENPPESGADDASILRQAQEILESMGYRQNAQERISQKVQKTVRDTGVSLATALTDSLLETVVHTLLFLLTFLVLTLVLRLVMKALDLVARLPGLHFLNSLGGAAIGLAESVLVLFLVFWVLDRFGVRIAQSTIDDTYLLRFFVTEGPLGFLSSL